MELLPDPVFSLDEARPNEIVADLDDLAGLRCGILMRPRRRRGKFLAGYRRCQPLHQLPPVQDVGNHLPASGIVRRGSPIDDHDMFDRPQRGQRSASEGSFGNDAWGSVWYQKATEAMSSESG